MVASQRQPRRRGKGRTRRLRRKQIGGGGELIYIFEDKTGEVISSDDLKPKKKYSIAMVENRDESIISHCRLEFEFDQLGEISMILCDPSHPLEPYKYKSYLIIQQCLLVLKEKGIRMVYLLPVSNVTKGFMKLYNFYKQMGFVCISETEFRHVERFESNDERAAFVSSKQAESNAFLDQFITKNKAGALDNKNIMSCYNSCTYMAGNIDELMANIESKITEWTST